MSVIMTVDLHMNIHVYLHLNIHVYLHMNIHVYLHTIHCNTGT